MTMMMPPPSGKNSAAEKKKKSLLLNGLSASAGKRYATAEARAIADIRPERNRPSREQLDGLLLVTEDVFSHILRGNVTYKIVFLQDWVVDPRIDDNMCFTNKSTLNAIRNCSQRVPDNVAKLLVSSKRGNLSTLILQDDDDAARVWVKVSSIPNRHVGGGGGSAAKSEPPRRRTVVSSSKSKRDLLHQLPKPAQTRYAALEKRVVRETKAPARRKNEAIVDKIMLLTRDTLALVPENAVVRTAFLEDFAGGADGTDEFCYGGTYSRGGKRSTTTFTPCAAGGSDENIAEMVGLDTRRGIDAKNRYFVFNGDNSVAVWVVVSSLLAAAPQAAQEQHHQKVVAQKKQQNKPPLSTATGVRALLQPAKLLYDRAFSDRVNVNACNLGLPDLQLSAIPKRVQPISGVIVLFGELLGQAVAVKLIFEERNLKESNGFLVEQRFYSQVVPGMLRSYTPNLVSFVGRFTCSKFRSELRRSSNKKAQQLLKVLEKTVADEAKKKKKKGGGGGGNTIEDKFDLDEATFLVTAKASGHSLGMWIGSDAPPKFNSYRKWSRPAQRDFINQVLLQIAYTLEVFGELGISHNDFHADNVLVEKLSRPVTLKYAISRTEVVEVSVRYFCRIFDFDHSAQQKTKWNKKRVIKNAVLERLSCRDSGECNEYLKNRDWFQILHYIWLWSAPDDEPGKREPMIRDLVPAKLLEAPMADEDTNKNKNRLAWPGHACRCNNGACSSCTPDIANLRLVTNPLDFIRQQFGKNIRKVRDTFSEAKQDADIFMLPSLLS